MSEDFSINMQRFRVNNDTGEKTRDLFWEQMGASSGDTNAMVQLGVAYLQGDGVEQDVEIASAWFEWAAEHENSWGMYNLAVLYGHGYGIERSFEKALHWMEKAAELDEGGADAGAEMYRTFIESRKAAETGDPDAMGKYAGNLMAHGNMINPEAAVIDYQEAFEWATKAAEAGSPDGMYTLALSYERGRYVEQNIQEAVKWHKKAADLNYGAAQYNLGCIYLREESMKDHMPEVIDLFKQAAENGNTLGLHGISKCYELGLGVEVDHDKAIEWGEKAAEKIAELGFNATGDYATQHTQSSSDLNVLYELAKLYTDEDENGKMINAERARYWLSKAAEKGHQKAQFMLNFTPLWEKQ